MKNITQINEFEAKLIIKLITPLYKAISSLLFFVVVIITMIFFEKLNFFLISLLVSIIIACLIFIIFCNKILFKKHQTNFKNNNRLYFAYIFNENNLMIVKFNNDKINYKLTLNYDDVLKIVEYNDYLVIFKSFTCAYILKEDSMTAGNINNLIKFLKQSVKNYQVKN